MDRLDHQAVAYGFFAALGDAFRPLPDAYAAQLRDRAAAARRGQADAAQATSTWTLLLSLPIAVVVYAVRADGRRMMTGKILGGVPGTPTSATITAPDDAPYTYVLIEACSGAYVTSFNAAATETVAVGPDDLGEVNNPGLPGIPGVLPTPASSGSPLPGDSPPIVVGTGTLPKGFIVVRTQCWQKAADSYSLPPQAGLSVTQTETSGVTSSTSDMKEVATMIDISTSLGWGPISASLSASMGRTSSASQEVTISDETTATVQREYSNPYAIPMVVLLWQLVDRYYIIHKSAAYPLKAMIENVVLPPIPRVYDADGNPFPPSDPALYAGPSEAGSPAPREDER